MIELVDHVPNSSMAVSRRASYCAPRIARHVSRTTYSGARYRLVHRVKT